uniref:Cathepsin H n=1 Tax=Zonotrichia albicollis TaxID=44394 RepID=A0A8D2MQP8_ZONAL
PLENISASASGAWIPGRREEECLWQPGHPRLLLQVFLVCLPGTWSHFQGLPGVKQCWWWLQPAAWINQLSVRAVQLLFESLTLSTGVGRSLTQNSQALTQNPSLQAEQQLVDCAQAFNNHGCSGGLPSQAFEYILYNKGLMGEDSYPYRAKNGTCKFQPEKAIAFVKDVINITQYDEDGMVEAVGKHNPVSFAFEVTSDFMHYRKGVYSNPRCEHTPDKVNHAVLAVGYGEEDGTPYWIVKNSWGRLWGMQGYFLIERGKNMCGLAACASYPVPRV